MDDSFLSEENCEPNLNSWVGAGRISKLEPLPGKTPGLAFTVDYRKTWPNGGHDIWPLRCYTSGAERVAQLQWMQLHSMVIVAGEVTNRNTIYARQVQPWTPAPKEDQAAWDEDDFPTQQTRSR
jgi:hypothetical protein